MISKIVSIVNGKSKILNWLAFGGLALGVAILPIGFWQVSLALVCLSGLYAFFTADIFKLLLFMIVFTAFNAITMVILFNFMPVSGMKVVQTWREVLEVIILLRIVLITPSRMWQTRLTIVDYAVLFFLLLNFVYALLPIGVEGIADRIIALRYNVGHFLAFFIGRLIFVAIGEKRIIGLWIGALGIMCAIVASVELFLIPESFLVKVINYPRYFNAFTGFYPGRKEGILPAFYYYNETVRRAGSFVLSSLELYTFMILTALLLIGWWLTANYVDRKKWQIWAAVALAMVLLAFTLSFTRAAYPLMLLVFVIVGFVGGTPLIRRVMFGLTGLGILAFIGLFIASSSIRDVVIKTITFDESSSSEHLRRILQGLDAFKDAPFGYGIGVGGITGLRIGVGLGGENSYIARMVDFGILGGLSYLGVLLAFMYAGWKASRFAEIDIDRIFGLVLLAFTVQFALHSLVSEDFLFKVSTHYMFLIAGFVAAWWSEYNRSKPEIAPTNNPVREPVEVSS
jgi:hypothetical protein